MRPAFYCNLTDCPNARFAFVMDGTVVVTAGAETRTLKEDDFAYFPPAEAHRRVSFAL